MLVYDPIHSLLYSTSSSRSFLKYLLYTIVGIRIIRTEKVVHAVAVKRISASDSVVVILTALVVVSWSCCAEQRAAQERPMSSRSRGNILPVDGRLASECRKSVGVARSAITYVSGKITDKVDDGDKTAD